MNKLKKIIKKTQDLAKIKEEDELIRAINALIEDLKETKDNVQGNFLTHRNQRGEPKFLCKDKRYSSEEIILDLEQSNAVDAYRKFWKRFSEKYNSFGAGIPYDVVSEKSRKILIDRGWEILKVKIYQFSAEDNIERLLQTLKEQHKVVSVVQDDMTQGHYVFHFMVLGELY